jgi:enoyl-CoA hydratase
MTNKYTCFDLEIKNKVAYVTMCRPDEYNSMNKAFWSELPHLVEKISDDASARVIVLSSTGKHFCAGMDLANFSLNDNPTEPKSSNTHNGMKKEAGFRITLDLQHTITSLEKARIPVISAIQGGCIGGGLDLATATDMRFCTKEAFFCIQEINIGMAADVGTLQRIPRLIPEGVVRELAYTGRRFFADEAKAHGLVNKVFDSHEEMMSAVKIIAEEIASKGPLAIAGTKEILNYGRDHTIEESLNHVALWNAAMGISDEMSVAFEAKVNKKDPEFDDLIPRTGKKYLDGGYQG